MTPAPRAWRHALSLARMQLGNESRVTSQTAVGDRNLQKAAQFSCLADQQKEAMAAAALQSITPEGQVACR